MSESSENSYIENFEVGDIVCWNSTINLENEKQNVGIILRIDKDSFLIVKELGNVHKTYFLSPISATKISF